MFNHIVVPLDGSKLSEAALAYVAPLALRMNSKVVLLHADSDPYADMFGVQGAGRDEGSLPNATDYLQSVSERLQSEGVQCETHHEVGAPAATILKYVDEHQPDLIALSTHGRSGVRRMVVGSVTTTILPRAQTPVLVIHPPEDDIVPETTFQNLVIPLDMSERSEDVLPQAMEFAEALSLDTTLVTCIPSASQLYIGAVPEVYPYPDDLMQQAQESSEEYLQGTAAIIEEGRQIRVQWESLEGGPANKIVEYAEAQQNSLIAMCTQGRTGLGRWVLGSVTDAVIRAGNTPVLVVPHGEDG